MVGKAWILESNRFQSKFYLCYSFTSWENYSISPSFCFLIYKVEPTPSTPFFFASQG